MFMYLTVTTYYYISSLFGVYLFHMYGFVCQFNPQAHSSIFIWMIQDTSNLCCRYCMIILGEINKNKINDI